MSGKASIIILTYNNLEYTRQCLESVYRHTAELDFEVIVVDNASQDSTPRFLKEFAEEHANLHLVLSPENLGFARGNNLGAAEATGDTLIFLNNDVIVTKGWLGGLIRHFTDSEIGMVGPVTNASGNESAIAVDYRDPAGIEAFAERYTQAHAGMAFEISMLPFQCVALPRRVFDEIGPLDERFGVGMFEDDDYALRLKQKGYKILCVEDVYVHHFGSASFSQLSAVKYWRIFRENLHKFEVKWGIRWQPHVQRPELMPQQYRNLMDGTVYFSTLNEDNEKRITDLENWTRELESRLQRLYELEVTLKDIYASNGWVFLQKVLAVRRRVIPEGSRRERLLRLLFGYLRHFRPDRLKTLLGDVKASLRSTAPVSVSTLQQSLGYAPLPAQLPEEEAWFGNRYPWPLISVLLPVYNHADLLESAARSVLFCSYPNFELVILDDGSTDQIEPVLRRLLANPHVRVFRQPNQKLPRALSHGHQFVRGDFITWTSADNLMAPAALERMARALLEHPEAVLVYADVGIIDEEGKPLRDQSYRPQNVDPAHPAVIRLYRDARPLGYEADNYINACFLYRREAAEALEGHYADDLRGLEDYDFWLRLQKCGDFYHLQNAEPLYFYRVHKRTMSHELLTVEREQHLQRGRQFIEYEGKRREFTLQRWSIIIDERLPSEEKRMLANLSAQLPVDCIPEESARNGICLDQKVLHFYPEGAAGAGSLYVQDLPHAWRLTWRSPWSDTQKSLDFWKGMDISPLALKAREHNRNRGEFPQAGKRPVVGFHARLIDCANDAPTIRHLIRQNPGLFFVLVDTPDNDHSRYGQELIQELENAVYAGSRPFGEAYALYAGFDAIWFPPLNGTGSELIYRTQLALAYAIGRPLIASQKYPHSPAPYQVSSLAETGKLNMTAASDRKSMDSQLLNRYLHVWSTCGAIEQLLNYANGIAQGLCVPRPDFAIPPVPATLPKPWSPARCQPDQLLKCALVVDSLDKGGLEELVAQLACGLPEYGFQTFVLCTKSGGAVADRLRASGMKVYIAEGDQSRMLSILQKEKPHLVNTHLADQRFLEICTNLGLPLVETIHNTYVWLGKEAWQAERARSRAFTHAIAVSELVRNFYTIHNHAFPMEWISIVPNGIDTSRVKEFDRKTARRELELQEGEVLFVCLASYDGRKNQLGILAAFNEIARRFPQAQLWCAGGVADPEYHQKVVAYRAGLPARDRIRLDQYREDISRLLSAADAFVLDSFFEGWSMAATEALTMGTPLIHSDCGSGRELVGQAGERGVLVPNPACDPLVLTWDSVVHFASQEHQPNTADLVQAMARIIEERAAWESRREAIREYACAEFGLAAMLKRYNQVYREICTG